MLGLSALLVAGVALKEPLLEQWHIRRLESSDPAQRNAAATRLGEMKSIRAIPALVRAVGTARPYYGERFQAIFPSTEAAAKSLVAIGARAIPAILELFRSDAPEMFELAAEMLSEISPDGTAMLHHNLIRSGFIPGWKPIADPDQLEQTFATLEHNLNAIAAKRGELLLTIPIACIEARKP